MLLTAVLRRTDSGDTLLWADAADDIIAIHGYRSTFRMLAAETTAYPREVAEHAWSYQLPDVVERAYPRGTHFVNRTALMDDWGAFRTQVHALMPVWYCSTTSRPFSGSSTLVDTLTFTKSRSLEPIPLADQMWNSMT